MQIVRPRLGLRCRRLHARFSRNCISVRPFYSSRVSHAWRRSAWLRIWTPFFRTPLQIADSRGDGRLSFVAPQRQPYPPRWGPSKGISKIYICQPPEPWSWVSSLHCRSQVVPDPREWNSRCFVVSLGVHLDRGSLEKTKLWFTLRSSRRANDQGLQ